MQTSIESELRLIRRRDRPEDPLDYRRVRRAVEGGVVARIAPGAFAKPTAWTALTPMGRHRVRTIEAADRMQAPAVISHHAAAAIHGIDVLGSWPERIDVRVAPGSGGRSTGLIRRHALGIDDLDLVEWRGHLLTSPAQTALDLAAAQDFLHGVVALDRVLWAGRSGGWLATIDDLRILAGRRASPKGSARIRKAVEFATHLSDSVRETQSRVLLAMLGFPTPELQHPIVLADGRTAYSDFFFADFDHTGEFDGVGKYLDPDLLEGRTPEEALIAEKDRSDAIRRVVSRESRWRTPDLRRPRRLYDILTADGLPSSKPPPPSGLVIRE